MSASASSSPSSAFACSCGADWDVREHYPILLCCGHNLCAADVQHMLAMSGKVTCAVCKAPDYRTDLVETSKNSALMQMLGSSHDNPSASVSNGVCHPDHVQRGFAAFCTICNILLCVLCACTHHHRVSDVGEAMQEAGNKAVSLAYRVVHINTRRCMRALQEKLSNAVHEKQQRAVSLRATFDNVSPSL